MKRNILFFSLLSAATYFLLDFSLPDALLLTVIVMIVVNLNELIHKRRNRDC